MTVSLLNNAASLREIAQDFADGKTRKEMMETHGVSDPATVTRWRRDPRVKAIVEKLLHDRIVRISSRVDSVIEGRLSQAAEMSTKDLLDIRKEYGGSALTRKDPADNDTVNEAIDALEEDPNLAEKLLELIQKPPAEAS